MFAHVVQHLRELEEESNKEEKEVGNMYRCKPAPSTHLNETSVCKMDADEFKFSIFPLALGGDIDLAATHCSRMARTPIQLENGLGQAL